MENKLEELNADFPDLFRDIYFECGPGWYDLLHELAEKLTVIIKRSPQIDGCMIYATQVKEKYGRLAFYMSCETDAITELLREYEEKSMIIFDLDGTLADCEHRRHFVDPEKYPKLCEYSNYRIIGGEPILDLDGKASWRYKKTGEPFEHGWKVFYEACDKDEPITPVIKALHSVTHIEGRFEIWSGRCESVREKTIDWLYDNVDLEAFSYFNTDKHLKMRPIGDNTPDDKLKERWLDEAIASGKTINYVFDDRPKVIRMWRRRGIFVFNCNQNDEEF